jgi:hypothetical protein
LFQNIARAGRFGEDDCVPSFLLNADFNDDSRQSMASSSVYTDDDGSSRASFVSTSSVPGSSSAYRQGRRAASSSAYQRDQHDGSSSAYQQDQHDGSSSAYQQDQHDGSSSAYQQDQLQHDGLLSLVDLPCQQRSIEHDDDMLHLPDIAPVFDSPQSALTHGDYELCKNFLSSDTSHSASTLDELVAIVDTYYSSLFMDLGRYARGLIPLPQLELLGGALQLESVILSVISAHCGTPVVANVTSLDITALYALFPVQHDVGALLLRRKDAFTFRVQLLDRTSLLYLLVVHMVSLCVSLVIPVATAF